MRLTEVGLDHFRNLASVTLEVSPAGAVLVGSNGQGKSNFLEAIHYLARFRSFRGTRHADSIAFGAEHFRVEGHVVCGTGQSRRVAVAADRRTRRVSLDGQPVARPADAVGSVVAVLLAPADLAIIGGGPDQRRRYLDGLLTSTSRRYARALPVYERALRQRNELLRKWPPVAGPELASWDETLIETGMPIVLARAVIAERLARRFTSVGAQVAGAVDRLGYELEYRPSVPGSAESASNAESIAAGWRHALTDSRQRDQRQGWTTVGPHRDELLVQLGGHRLAQFGSQGEQRTAAIALRLAEAELLESESEHIPVLLLDDVFSELDKDRAGRLLEWLGNRHQKFVTTPRPLPQLGNGLVQWRVDEGRIAPRLAAA